MEQVQQRLGEARLEQPLILRKGRAVPSPCLGFAAREPQACFLRAARRGLRRGLLDAQAEAITLTQSAWLALFHTPIENPGNAPREGTRPTAGRACRPRALTRRCWVLMISDRPNGNFLDLQRISRPRLYGRTLPDSSWYPAG